MKSVVTIVLLAWLRALSGVAVADTWCQKYVRVFLIVFGRHVLQNCKTDNGSCTDRYNNTDPFAPAGIGLVTGRDPSPRLAPRPPPPPPPTQPPLVTEAADDALWDKSGEQGCTLGWASKSVVDTERNRTLMHCSASVRQGRRGTFRSPTRYSKQSFSK
jgi:hypothetical protein